VTNKQIDELDEFYFIQEPSALFDDVNGAKSRQA